MMGLLPDDCCQQVSGGDESGLNGLDEVTGFLFRVGESRGRDVRVDGGVKALNGLTDVFHVPDARFDNGFLGLGRCLLVIHGIPPSCKNGW